MIKINFRRTSWVVISTRRLEFGSCVNELYICINGLMQEKIGYVVRMTNKKIFFSFIFLQFKCHQMQFLKILQSFIIRFGYCINGPKYSEQ